MNIDTIKQDVQNAKIKGISSIDVNRKQQHVAVYLRFELAENEIRQLLNIGHTNKAGFYISIDEDRNMLVAVYYKSMFK